MTAWLLRAWHSDVLYSFRRSPTAVGAAVPALLLLIGAAFAPVLAPHDPTDLASLSVLDSFKTPFFMPDGDASNLLGTDNQGRDVLSAVMYGLRISLMVSLCAVVLAIVAGIMIGLTAGYVGGMVDAALMRVADIQLTFPAILTALLIDGVIGAALPKTVRDSLQLYVMIFAIGVSLWPAFARAVRGSTLVERNKDYVLAAHIIGVPAWRIMLTHVLPNAMGPVLVIGTINLGLAVLTEATLSFLGVGLPATRPSLGTLIRIGNEFLFSGQWWVVIFPGLALALTVLSINLLGDWLRDALNPKLR